MKSLPNLGLPLMTKFQVSPAAYIQIRAMYDKYVFSKRVGSEFFVKLDTLKQKECANLTLTKV